MSTAIERVEPGPVELSDTALTMFERLATNPDVDVAKLEKLIDMQERIIRLNAKAAFDAAFSKMWPELPEVDERGSIKARDGSVRSRYAKYEDIQAAIRPVLQKFGFALRHRTEFPGNEGIIRVVGVLSGHGHTEESAFEARPDKNDARSAIQDQGSTVSYGMRYTTIGLLNIITRGVDNDGQNKAQEPDGFAAWWDDMTATADNGAAALEKAWSKSPKPFKEFALNHKRDVWSELKKKAAARG